MLTIFKLCFDQNSKLQMLYDITCMRYNLAYVGQTSRLITTRVAECHKIYWPVNQNVNESCNISRVFVWLVTDQCNEETWNSGINNYGSNKSCTTKAVADHAR